MRLFAAIDLDEPARLAVAEVQASLGSVFGRDLRSVLPAQMHITLVFLGDVSAPQVDAITARIAQPSSQPAFDVELHGVGVFPPRGAPRALWIGVRGGDGNLQELHREFAGRLERFGITAGSGPFRPHVTLARFRHSRLSDRRTLQGQPALDRGIRLRIDRVTLYQSVLSSGPPRYVALARANLTST